MRGPGSRSPRAWGDAVRLATSHRGPWPRVSIWHGTADPTVAYANAEALARQWADVHGLEGEGTPGLPPVPSNPKLANPKLADPKLARRVWGQRDGRPLVELVTVPGMGHGTALDPAGASGEPLGQAAPFMLDAGVSSTLALARDWGLVR